MAKSRFPKFIGARVYATAGLTMSSGVMQYPILDGVQEDTHKFSDGSKLVIPNGLTGRYRLSAGGRFAAYGAGYRYTAIEKNGPMYLVFNQVRSDGSYPQITNLVYEYFLTQGESVRLALYQTSGQFVTAEAGADSNWLSLEYLGHAI